MLIFKGKNIVRIKLSVFVAAFLVATSVFAPLSAFAFDPKAQLEEDAGPSVLFRFGFSAYKSGAKEKAAEAYKYAAKKGHSGARWALANMYAAGDGVLADEFAAFQMYDDIARQGISPGSQDAGYFANALVSLAGYYQRGIPNSPVKIDLRQSRQLYFHAASVFGIPEAQFRLAMIILENDGVKNKNRQAKKWLNRARKKGHNGASAILGNLMFEEGHTVRGLALLTVALKRSGDGDALWINQLHEQAFSIAGEPERRTAIALAHDLIQKGH